MQSEQDRANPPPTKGETVAVHPARLAWKGAGRETCEGDIRASCSADVHRFERAGAQALHLERRSLRLHQHNGLGAYRQRNAGA